MYSDTINASSPPLRSGVNNGGLVAEYAAGDGPG